jgi:RNA polymerase sigma-70 factor (ECF subfamily)
MDEDTGVIRRVLGGETDAFRLLVERYERPLFALIHGLLDRPNNAEDIAQDVFCAAYENLPGFEPGRARFCTWLFTIARNRCLNERRRVRPVALAGVDPPQVDPPEAALARQETLERLDRALAALPAAQRTALVLADLAGLAHEDVAAIEGTTVGTVKSRVSRARERLRESLGRHQGDEP